MKAQCFRLIRDPIPKVLSAGAAVRCPDAPRDGIGRCRGKYPSAEPARGSSGSLCPLSAGWTLIMDHNVAAERSVAPVSSRSPPWPPLAEGHYSPKPREGGRPPSSVTVTGISGAVSPTGAAICPLLKWRQHRHQTEIFIPTQYGLFLLKAT